MSQIVVTFVANCRDIFLPSPSRRPFLVFAESHISLHLSACLSHHIKHGCSQNYYRITCRKRAEDCFGRENSLQGRPSEASLFISVQHASPLLLTEAVYQSSASCYMSRSRPHFESRMTEVRKMSPSTILAEIITK